MRIVGLSAYYHDSAAALIEDGWVVAAAQEERFSRRKHDAGFPRHALAYCLAEAGTRLADVDYIAFYDKPFLKFERLLETYLQNAPRGYRSFRVAMPVWLREKLFLKNLLLRELKAFGPPEDMRSRLRFAEHHHAHAASAFYPSPFRDAAVLTMDGVGEWATTSLAHGTGRELAIEWEIHFPHSLGLLYSAFTYYTGFKVNSGEYKVMGLAPYGVPRYAQTILDNLIDLRPDGSFRLDLAYFDYCVGLRMTNERFHALFGGPPRAPEAALEQHHLDLAASVQAVLEEAVLRMTRFAAGQTGSRNLCLAGGVALNCVANGRILRDGSFDRLWVQPAAGDAGGALGAAFATYHHHLEQPRVSASGPDGMKGALLGPSYPQDEIERRLLAVGARFTTHTQAATIDHTTVALEAGMVVGWFQGRMEFGPRALGARSILADPRPPAMQRILNEKIKLRESFRPFAPAIRREDLDEWFDLGCDSPYMLLTGSVCADRRVGPAPDQGGQVGLEQWSMQISQIPAVTHVDYSARIQTVDAATHPLFHALLSRFNERTGCPVLVNTSFNVRGEPIVCTPEDAFRCFVDTDMDLLVIGGCLLRKEDQQVQRHHPLPAAYATD